MEASREFGAGETQTYIDELEDILGSDDPEDTRFANVVAMIEAMLDYAVDFAADLCASEEIECLETALVIVPELLKKSVINNIYAPEQNDRLRNMYEGLIRHAEYWVSEAAIQKYKTDSGRMAAEDTVSFDWLRWSAANTRPRRPQSRPDPNYLIEHGFAKNNIRLIGTRENTKVESTTQLR